MTSIKAAKINRIGYSIEAFVLTLMATGAVFVFSAGASVSAQYDFQTILSLAALKQILSFTILKQLFFLPLAIAVMYLMAGIDYRRFSFTRAGYFKSFTPYLLALSITLLVLVLIPGIGQEKNYARRWLAIKIGSASISFQPSELAKWSLVIFLAAFLDKYADTMKLFLKRFVPVCLVAGAVVALIVTQDFGTAAFISLLTFLMLLIGRVRWRYFLTSLPVIAPLFYFAIVTSPSRINRLRAFFFPGHADSNSLYQAKQSLIAISSGGIFGKGLGRGILKYGHLPEDTTDFIFAVIAEELGFVGGIVVIAVFVGFIVAGILLIRRCEDPFGRLLAAGIVLTIGIQAAINIGVVTVVLPTKGISLPFISAGGSGMVLSAAAVGILLNIAAQSAKSQEIDQ